MYKFFSEINRKTADIKNCSIQPRSPLPPFCINNKSVCKEERDGLHQSLSSVIDLFLPFGYVTGTRKIVTISDVIRRRGIWRKRGNRNINESNNNLTD